MVRRPAGTDNLPGEPSEGPREAPRGRPARWQRVMLANVYRGPLGGRPSQDAPIYSAYPLQVPVGIVGMTTVAGPVSARPLPRRRGSPVAGRGLAGQAGASYSDLLVLLGNNGQGLAAGHPFGNNQRYATGRTSSPPPCLPCGLGLGPRGKTTHITCFPPSPTNITTSISIHQFHQPTLHSPQSQSCWALPFSAGPFRPLPAR